MTVADPRGNLTELFVASAEAEASLGRVDERLKVSAAARAWSVRAGFHEATAWAWSRGASVPIEDLVLHDAMMDVRMPDQDLRQAHAALVGRRRAEQGGRALLSWNGVTWLSGSSDKEPLEGGVAASGRLQGDGFLESVAEGLGRLGEGRSDEPREMVEEWLRFVGGLEGGLPPALAAAAALEAWRVVAPLPHSGFVGGQLVAVWLKASGRTGKVLPCLEVGARQQRGQVWRLDDMPLYGRLEYWLRRLTLSADFALGELRALETQRALLLRRVVGRRRNSRLPQAIEIVLAHPVVTAPMLAEALRISQQAARGVIEALGPTLKERSGRARFRAWGL